MTNIESLKLINKLISGIDPRNDEQIKDDCIFNNPQIMRALISASKCLSSVSQNPQKRGMKWSNCEIEALKGLFHQGLNFDDIAQRLERTKGAITSRLVTIGLIEDTYRRL